MPGVVFFDKSRRLCMTIDDETVRPGSRVRAVVWRTVEADWGPPTEVPYGRAARLADLSDDQFVALDVPAVNRAGPSDAAIVRALCPPGRPR